MARTLNELSASLKEFITENMDAHNITGMKQYRYNNLKIVVADPRITKVPQFIITIGMPEATFNLLTGEKLSGGLGPDEKYVYRWIDRGSNKQELIEAYRRAERQIGKAQGAE